MLCKQMVFDPGYKYEISGLPDSPHKNTMLTMRNGCQLSTLFEIPRFFQKFNIFDTKFLWIQILIFLLTSRANVIT